GVAYRCRKWTDGRKVCCVMVCSREGKSSYKQQGKARVGALSARINCRMQFSIKCLDQSSPNCSQWAIQHARERKSIIHNHPPEKDSSAYAKHRRATR